MLNDISRHTFYMSQLVRLEGKHATQNAHCEMLGYICKPCCHSNFQFPISIKFNECLSNIHCHLIRINILTFQSIEPLPLKADFGSNDRKTGQLKMNERYGVLTVHDSDNDFSLLVVNEEDINQLVAIVIVVNEEEIVKIKDELD